MHILVIQNCETEGIGLYQQSLKEFRIQYTIIHPYNLAKFPLTSFDAIIVGGTPISVYHKYQHAFLQQEWNFLQRMMDEKKPILGICAGGQMLSMLLGGSVRRNPVMEIGGYDVTLTKAGRQNPIFRDFPESFPVFQWHGDTFTIPGDSELLVEGQDCKHQAFRYANFIGVQFHLEVTTTDAAKWADKYNNELTQVHKTKTQVVCECKERLSEMAKLSKLLMSNFLELVG